MYSDDLGEIAGQLTLFDVDERCPEISPWSDLQCLLWRGHEGTHQDGTWEMEG